ncbi:MAG TPA: tRNA-binding protein [Longimicrobiales bacterium]|nr:tRNA-binding protein [Longimicrobiales bacterium]
MAETATADIETFLALDIRAGVVTHAEAFPEARTPALRLRVDFGPELGEKTSSAQLTRRYTPEGLIGSVVLAVVNFPPRRVAGFRSEVLVLGVVDPADPGDIVLVRPDAVEGDVRGWRLA